MSRPDEGLQRERIQEQRRALGGEVQGDRLRDLGRSDTRSRGAALLELLENTLDQARATETQARELADGLCGSETQPERAPSPPREMGEDGVLDSYLRRVKGVMERLNATSVELTRIEREFRM